MRLPILVIGSLQLHEENGRPTEGDGMSIDAEREVMLGCCSGSLIWS